MARESRSRVFWNQLNSFAKPCRDAHPQLSPIQHPPIGAALGSSNAPAPIAGSGAERRTHPPARESLVCGKRGPGNEDMSPFSLCQKQGMFSFLRGGGREPPVQRCTHAHTRTHLAGAPAQQTQPGPLRPVQRWRLRSGGLRPGSEVQSRVEPSREGERLWLSPGPAGADRDRARVERGPEA